MGGYGSGRRRQPVALLEVAPIVEEDLYQTSFSQNDHCECCGGKASECYVRNDRGFDSQPEEGKVYGRICNRCAGQLALMASDIHRAKLALAYWERTRGTIISK